MSPILVRPVREQLEHDRVIRLLQARFRRRFDVTINPGAEQNSAIGTGPSAIFPDVVLTSLDRARRVEAVVEVETVESVNNLEAMAEWIPLGRLRTAFHLYVPASMVDVARRLCTDFSVPVAEVHSYHWIGDEMRFVAVYKAPASAKSAAKMVSLKAPARPASAKAAKPAPAKAKSKAKKASPAPKTKPRKQAGKSGRKAGKPAKRK